MKNIWARRLIVVLCICIAFAPPVDASRLLEFDLAETREVLPGCVVLAHDGMIADKAPLDPEVSYRAGLCLGMASSVAISFYGEDGICMPENYVAIDLIRVLTRFVGKHPSQLKNLFATTVAEALLDAWACRDAGDAPSAEPSSGPRVSQQPIVKGTAPAEYSVPSNGLEEGA